MMVSIIIVNYNMDLQVSRCLNSIFDTLTGNYEVIVVDNNSTNRGIEVVADNFKKNTNLKFLQLEKNYGFGKGNNEGVKISKGEIILFLNPDAYLINNILPEIESLFIKNPFVSVVGPLIKKNEKEKEISFGNFPTFLSEFGNIFFINNLLKKILSKKYFAKEDECINVNWVTGSAMFIRSSDFIRIGGFDENIFLYNEEVDLCKRIRKSEKSIIFCQHLVVFHEGSVGSKKNYYTFTVNSYGSKIYYLKKHFTGLKQKFVLTFLYLHLTIFTIIWGILFTIKPTKAKEKIAGVISLLKNEKHLY